MGEGSVMGKMILAHLVMVWAWLALFVGAFDPLGEFSNGEQVFNGVVMLLVAGGASNWAAKTRAQYRDGVSD